MTAQTSEVDVVDAGVNDGVKLEECDAAAGHPVPRSTSIVVINTDAGDILKLYPATGGDIGNGANASIDIPAVSVATCNCYKLNNWRCTVDTYE